ncbi:MAG TPA: hypothetical protein VMU67_15905 [Steroidobacteraceae bacterium]|nr:hypothetical protein [Steroidobacteraceae bacterium]
MKPFTGFLILAGTQALLGCASQAPAASNAPSAAQPVAPAVVAAAPQTGTTPTTKFTVPSGYRHRVVNGEDVYCHKDPVTGSRTEMVETCLTLAQLQARAESSKDFIESVQRSGSTNITTNTPGAGGAMGH